MHDSRMLAPLLDSVAPVHTGRRGRPRRRPAKLHADKGYDYRRCRDECARRGIKHRIARKGVESTAKLGTHRWIVERTLAWLARYRRLTIRYGGRTPAPRRRAPRLPAPRLRPDLLELRLSVVTPPVRRLTAVAPSRP